MSFEIRAWEENADTCKKILKQAIQRGHNSRGPSGSLYIFYPPYPPVASQSISQDVL